MSVRWTEEQLMDFLRQRDQAQPPAARALEKAGLPTLEKKPSKKKAAAPSVDLGGSVKIKKKRRGVEVGPIVDSLRKCSPRVRVQPGDLPVMSFLFEGARVLTVNEIISILQYRKHEVFRYKAAWRLLIKRALHLLDRKDLVHFAGPVRLEIVRRGAKTLDDDASRMPFKYAIDSLVRCGVLPDDNREVVADTQVIDVVGPPAIGIRIVALSENVRIQEVDPTPGWSED